MGWRERVRRNRVLDDWERHVLHAFDERRRDAAALTLVSYTVTLDPQIEERFDAGARRLAGQSGRLSGGPSHHPALYDELRSAVVEVALTYWLDALDDRDERAGDTSGESDDDRFPMVDMLVRRLDVAQRDRLRRVVFSLPEKLGARLDKRLRRVVDDAFSPEERDEWFQELHDDLCSVVIEASIRGWLLLRAIGREDASLGGRIRARGARRSGRRPS